MENNAIVAAIISQQCATSYAPVRSHRLVSRRIRFARFYGSLHPFGNKPSTTRSVNTGATSFHPFRMAALPIKKAGSRALQQFPRHSTAHVRPVLDGTDHIIGQDDSTIGAQHLTP